jgi:hypothetical protein
MLRSARIASTLPAHQGHVNKGICSARRRVPTRGCKVSEISTIKQDPTRLNTIFVCSQFFDIPRDITGAIYDHLERCHFLVTQ